MSRENKHKLIKRSSQRVAGQRAAAGFTLIELLVVIVVIAILASIAVVSYRGIQGRAAATVLQSDVRSSGNQLEIGMAMDGEYPNSSSGLPKSPGTDYEYDSDGSSYCLTATSSKSPKAYYISSESGGVKEGTCPGHSGPSSGGGGGSGGGTIADGTPIQNMTQTHCSNLAVYDGTNESALVSLTDSRGGTTRNYTVGKLADGNCWMLDNLKLGSTTGTTTLTPSDSDIDTTFNLPALSSTGHSVDEPRVYDPAQSTTGYGYLYNWSAATAGETQASMPANSSNAPHSICPKNWRLPTGGQAAGSSDFSKLDQSFGGSGLHQSSGPSISKWQEAGPFRGVLSGDWYASFVGKDVRGTLWSSSASLTRSDSAFNTNFASNYVYPGDYGGLRRQGLGVRCLLR